MQRRWRSFLAHSCSSLGVTSIHYALRLYAGAVWRQIGRDSPIVRPQSKAAEEGPCIVALATTQRQSFELVHVASADDGLVGLQRVDEAFYDIGNMTPPLLLAIALKARPSNVILVGALPVWQVGQLHRPHDAPADHRPAQAGSRA